MDDSKSKCLSEGGNTNTPAPGRDEVTEDKDNESPRNENAEEGDTEDFGMQLWSNHIIMREIMSHLDWREQVPCELVCRLWRDSVKSLQCQNLHSYDFTMQFTEESDKHSLHVSELPVRTRPMFAIGFYSVSDEEGGPCGDFTPAPCDPPCANEHEMTEAVHAIMLRRRSSLLAVDGGYMIYKPLPTLSTFQYTICDASKPCLPILVGLYLPKMPNVNYRTVQYRSEDTVQKDFYSIVDDICATDIIEGVVVFVNDEFLGFDDENLNTLIDYIKNKQRSFPFALGGCVVKEMQVCDGPKVDADVGATMGVFSVPKGPESVLGSRRQFKIHSLIIDGAVKEESALQEAIQTFAENITELQFSAALQFSSSEREQLHTVEQEIHGSCLTLEQKLFRASFPRTTLVGCHSYRVIGHSHPDIRPPQTKRIKRSSQGESEFLHSDSTVFFYFTWGKQRTSGEEAVA